MRKIISIALIGLLLLQTSDINISDVLQLKNLYQHAKFHQQMYGDGFFDFLAEHYGTKVHEHSDNHKEHHNLPLKHQHNCADAFTVFTFFNTNIVIKEQSFLEIKGNFSYKESSSTFEKTAVFQPPKRS